MLKFFFPTLMVTVLVAPTFAQEARPLQYRTIAVRDDKGGTLAVVNREVRLVGVLSAWTEWTLHETPKGWTIQVQPSAEATPQSRYLSVDEEGSVVLVAKPRDGAYWKLTPNANRLFSFDTTIQATAGKFKDWYLSFAEQAEEIEKGQSKHKSYRVKLLEKPGPRTELNIFIDGS